MLITIEVQFGHAFDCALFDNHLIALCKKFCGKYVKETRMPTDRHQREGPQRMASPWRSRHLTNALGYTATAELAPANGSATHKETRRLPIEPTALCCLLSCFCNFLVPHRCQPALSIQLERSIALARMLGQTVWRQLELRFDLSSMPFDDDSRTSFESEVVVILATSEQQRPASAS